MKKTALILSMAIFLPSLILGALALRTATEQRIILERRTQELYQTHADALASSARELVEAERQAFTSAVTTLLSATSPEVLAPAFAQRLAVEWPRASVGFAVTLDGRILSPTPDSASFQPTWQQFLEGNASFLTNRMASEIYQPAAGQEPAGQQDFAAQQVSTSWPLTGSQTTTAIPTKKLSKSIARQVALPQYTKGKSVGGSPTPSSWSKLEQYEAYFSGAISGRQSGTIARFVQDELEILFWLRPPQAPQLVFGAAWSPKRLRDRWRELLSGPSVRELSGVCVALLDERGVPVAKSVPGFQANWKRPFAATEVGEVLPRWEAALYLTHPDRLIHEAKLLSLMVILLIVVALSGIAWGGFLVMVDTHRQLALAQKKTDFVSNVSHELKSPLTSIRMFAELLQQGRVTQPERRDQYLRIMVHEAERLTRLINNVLDFARLERNQKHLDKRLTDLYPVIRQTWEAYETHLRSQGYTTRWEAAPPPYPVVGDPDAIAQILVNLLSNAEKYSPETKEVILRTSVEDSQVCLRILDRGLGVPAGHEQKIFEPFHRAHDSLASGIQGSGLGLTLARRLVAQHGGSITYEPREGGGSCFTVRLPLAAATPTDEGAHPDR